VGYKNQIARRIKITVRTILVRFFFKAYLRMFKSRKFIIKKTNNNIILLKSNVNEL